MSKPAAIAIVKNDTKASSLCLKSLSFLIKLSESNLPELEPSETFPKKIKSHWNYALRMRVIPHFIEKNREKIAVSPQES
jgi:hypothetical protein